MNLKDLKEQYKKERSEIVLRDREKSIRWRSKNLPKTLLSRAKANASKSKLEFNIEESDIIIPTHCPYLGIELTNIMGQGRVSSNLSIDRIDSSKGYIKGNIQIISDLANNMKCFATTEQLLAFAEGVLKIHGRTTDNKITSSS